MTVDELADLLRAARDAVVSTLSALFLGLSSYRENDAEAFARQAVPLILAGQRTVAEIVALYVQQTAQEQAPAGISIPPITIPDADVLGRLPGSEEFLVVYQRPFVTVWAELAKAAAVDPARVPDPVEVEGSMTRAVEKGDDRLSRMADMDLQQAASRAATAAMTALPPARRPAYYRRRLVGSENCALCTIASTNRYRIEHLKPVHPGCDCQVEPIYPGQDDPDDDALLEAAHAAAVELVGGDEDRGGRRVDYRKITLSSMERRHGELAAPLLANPRHDFTGPSQIPDSQPGDR